MYNWASVAQRTEVVYRRIMTSRTPILTLTERLRRFYGCGALYGKMLCALSIVDYFTWRFFEFWSPRKFIEAPVDMCEAYRRRERIVKELTYHYETKEKE